jgi:queuine/archaeosine tRNA-ribosyltransferase
MPIPLIYGFNSGCLTNRDWQEMGVTIAAASIDALLIKPGIAELKKINNITKWLGWHGQVILLFENTGSIKNNIYTIKSPYDGTNLSICMDDLNKMVLHLNADKILNFKDSCHDISDAAEKLAITGKFMVDHEAIADILDESFINDYSILSNNCKCMSCAQGFTKAYLQHLYAQTPLLAHRYLAMHNFFLL